jgi:DNA polymerase-3 subunit alpha
MAYVELHEHTEQSLLDGVPRSAEAVARAIENGNPALAITDHGTCAGHIEHQRECLAAGIDPIFGIETYFQPDRLARPPDTKDQQARLREMADSRGDLLLTPEARALSAQVEAAKDAQGDLRGGRHLILLAQGERGLRDMWAASTEASATGFYFKPRMDWALLEERGSDLIATTACLGGIISQDLLAGLRDRPALERALADLDRLKATFPGRLYLEMQANALPEQIRLNKMLVELSAALGVPLIAACDAHYLTPEDAPLHREWMLCQTGGGKEDYWHFSPMLPEDAVRASLGYLDPKVVDAAIRNTVEVAARCTARIDWHVPPPVFTPGGTADDDARRLRALCEEALPRVSTSREARDRLDYEFDVVAPKGFAGCYLIVEELVSYARSQGVLVGPGRGSAAGSFMSYLTGITSIDPIETGLMFERFLTPGRASMPDFDLDFPTSKRSMIQDHVMDRYGSDHVVRVGTVLRYQSKGILKKLFSVHARELPDDATAHFSEMSQIIDEAEAGTAGLGLPWDEILTDPRIAAYALKYPRIFETATALHGRVHAVGQHPAGLIISPQVPLAGQLPMRREEGGKSMLVSQWDYRAADELGLLKLDNLTLRNLDSLQEAIDLVEARTGIRLDPREWSGQYGDPQVFEEISAGRTLGMFQLETSLCRQYCLEMRPATLADLADLTTGVRPGPRNSGAMAKYLLRRAGREVVTYPHPLLEEILASTQGVLLYQEQVMNACKALAGYDDLEADGVRKILGKKLTSKVEAAGKEFIRRAVERGHDEEQMTALWADMAEFGKYAFNKCVTGDTLLHLAASSQYSHGEADVASLYRRIHAPLLPAIRGRTKTGDEYRGPCVACGGENSPRQWIRGLCSTCYVWRQKFHDPNRGLHGLSYWADRRIRPARIIDVVAQGSREVWKITLKDGRAITATGNHQHLTGAGYRRVDELTPGDCLVIDAGYEPDGYVPERHRLTRGDRRAEGKINGVSGEENYAFIDGGGAFWKRWKQTHPKVCAQCGADQGRIEAAHLDGDHANNVEGNLAWLCASCHKAYDYAHNDRPRRWQKGHRSQVVPIESIEHAGFQETYDVVMDSPHNFVANGIVTHNSHGYSYGVLSYWTAWMKTHYPVEMLTGILSTIDKMDRMAEFATEARRIGISVLPPDARFSGGAFSADGMSIRYGLTAIHGVGPQAIAKITAGQPYGSYDDFARRSGVNSGVLAALAKAGALDALVPSRRGLVRVIESDKDGSSVRCVHKNPEASGPNGLPCDYDWAGEPSPAPRFGASGRELKVIAKPPPKRCTVACRRYTPPGLPGMDGWGEYPPDALFRQDMETYGTWMSEVPFDQLEQLGAGMRERARRVALAVADAPEGSYPMTGILAEWHRATTRRGSAMWWVKLATEVSVVDMACFSPLRDSEPDAPAQLRSIRTGTLVAAEVVKRSYMSGGGFRMGWRLADVWALGS